MKILRIHLFASVFVIISSVHSQPALKIPDSYKYVKANLEFLASDELEGRETTSKGEKLASLFIAQELEKYGVKPFGDNGTYFQNFNMTVTGYHNQSNITIFDEISSPKTFINGEDILYNPGLLASIEHKNIKTEIIFAGYGITSEEPYYDSYNNLDVKGKVVLILSGTPQKNGKEIFDKQTIRKFSRSNAKADIAKKNGALGIISLPNEEILKYWDLAKNWASSYSFKLEVEDTVSPKDIIPFVTLNEKSAEYLLYNESISYDKIINLDTFMPKSFKLKKQITFNFEIFKEIRPTRNIIGLVEGTDQNLQNEYVTLGAHYDHVGFKGEDIFNGADDNGSGTVTILEVARQLNLNNFNKRPILFFFYTGEEKGLKGSKYLANYSPFVSDIIANINIDMVGRKSEDSIYCIGSDKLSTEMYNLVKDANSESSKFVLDYTFDEPNDPNRFYYRSDHVHYAMKGIPITFFYDYMQDDYHKPTDTFDKINFIKISKMVNFIYTLTLKISNLDHKLIVDKKNN